MDDISRVNASRKDRTENSMERVGVRAIVAAVRVAAVTTAAVGQGCAARGREWVGRGGNQRGVAGSKEAESRVADTFLGANQRQHLLVRVQLHVEAGVVPLGEGPTHLGQAVGLRIAVIRRVL